MPRLCIPVLIGSEVAGDQMAVVVDLDLPRLRVDTGGIPLPIGAVVTVTFGDGSAIDQISGRAVVEMVIGDMSDGIIMSVDCGLRMLDFDARLPLQLPARDALH